MDKIKIQLLTRTIKLISLSHFLRNREGALEESETQLFGAGKKCAIPSWVWALESTPSESKFGLTPTLRRVTLTNLIAGPLCFIARCPAVLKWLDFAPSKPTKIELYLKAIKS